MSPISKLTIKACLIILVCMCISGAAYAAYRAASAVNVDTYFQVTLTYGKQPAPALPQVALNDLAVSIEPTQKVAALPARKPVRQ